jgi:putative flippase GtrA
VSRDSQSADGGGGGERGDRPALAPRSSRGRGAVAYTNGRASTDALLNSRTARALKARHNWVQLLKFSTVGGSGYVVNLGIYVAALTLIGLDYYIAATISFLVAVTNNYLWNRIWTFRDQRGHFGAQGLRFLVVSVAAYAANILLLTLLIAFGLGEIVSQAFAIVLVTPINFIGNKLWSFRA